MSSRTAVLLAGALVTGLAWASAPLPAATALDPAPGVADLAQDLNRILADSRLDAARAGVVVRAAESGEELYGQDAGKIFTPASNTKLLTSAAAVDILGLDHRFRTEVLASGRRAGGVLTGDLYLKGTGDPTMLAADYDALAAEVAAAGVKVVTGRLVADDTWFDDVRLGTDWAWDDEPYYYAAQISALTASPDTDYDAGSVIVSVAPGGAAGTPAKVSTTPETGYLKIVNRATTGDSTDVVVQRQHGTNTVVITGTVAGAYEEWVAVDDPTGYAASLFRAGLAKHGVRVLGPTGRGAAPSGARSLAARESMPLSELLVPFLKLSNNMHAEILTKTIGRKVANAGTWSAGLAAIGEFARANGVTTSRLRDGSGLSRVDGLTPAGLTSLLIALRAKPWFPTWYAALPVAGEPGRMVGGTLRSRMRGTPAAGNVHAKTGSLTGVTSLSGYVTSADGEPLVFSIMINQYLSASPKDIEDQIAVRLARFSRTTPADVPATTRARTAGGQDAGDLECSWRKPAPC
ncbi:D-alanyl-D-alanine carboxypeptidase/D-alanyl-D-alanine-endopeptidase (penicillin-binding protein 4) [Thermocatellispora tengchongensis]|uniref:D-alanyl-D-alanine carboxypeptidase/D-alanyl-D-alanine-endopeptidase (Penicillin-binding protein 4) n=1 Tax=Thermocatellispora tengchongensis TaxID=1073253 RepID=A0A840P998_9ACTN|nr:D-alanyl-D-alanine carboxypeptidase/D-alanyl-D-alanine-endopeptidase [Thermocatellispora tengchongensis]MBB5132565.1 D-alanyl-D-alanine carboxypeptidase/D-alanyl-D-alanine-endopeptidase (penicillin-binding protein 4) [Thermocatellispora tengchongensis]